MKGRVNTVAISPTEAVMLPSQIPESQSILSSSDLDAERYMKINIEHDFCADYKMELLVLGMYAASGIGHVYIVLSTKINCI